MGYSAAAREDLRKGSLKAPVKPYAQARRFAGLGSQPVAPKRSKTKQLHVAKAKATGTVERLRLQWLQGVPKAQPLPKAAGTESVAGSALSSSSVSAELPPAQHPALAATEVNAAGVRQLGMELVMSPATRVRL